MDTPVDVLLATCNGEAFVGEFLDSLLVQSYSSFRVWVRDDDSDDATRAILASYLPRFHGRLIVLSDQLGRLGIVGNFERLLAAALADGCAQWFAFADQDDVWLPEKLAQFVRVAQGADDATHLPRLIFSDLTVVDREMGVVEPSLWRYEGIMSGDEQLSLLLGRNVVTGCASMVNRRLAEIALPFPDSILMHDWWCALIAGVGQISRIDAPLVLYRQHGGNSLGARKGGVLGVAQRFLLAGNQAFQRVKVLGVKTLEQTEAFAERLQQHELDADVARRYLNFRRSSLLDRFRCMPMFGRRSRIDDWIKLVLWSRALR